MKVGRDGQEIDPIAGRLLAELIDKQQPEHGRPKPLMIKGIPHQQSQQTTTGTVGSNESTEAAVDSSMHHRPTKCRSMNRSFFFLYCSTIYYSKNI